MTFNLQNIGLGLVLLGTGGLLAFSSVRNSDRNLENLHVKFVGEDNLFIQQETVSKLLIQNYATVTNVPKDIIDLNGLESALNSNPMIKDAQVYLSVDGVLTAEVRQKTPVARVQTNAAYYIDDEGSFMPLSKNYTARVPLITGAIEKNNLNEAYVLAKKIESDAFLKAHVVEIHQKENNTFNLKFRDYNFVVQLGTLSVLDKKINNLKAFYQKALKDKSLSRYSVVNLAYDSQVICTKK